MGYFFLLRDLFPLHTLLATDTVVFFRCTQNYGPSQKIVLDASPGASGQASQNAIEIQQVQSSSLPTAEHQRLHRGAFFSGVKMTAKMKYLKGTKEFKVFPDNDPTGFIHIWVFPKIGVPQNGW